MTIKDFFQYAAQQLKTAGHENSAFETRALIAQTLNMPHERLILNFNSLLDAAEVDKLQNALKRRCQHEPLAKIVGQKEFWGLSFKVNHCTLDPRPDSETLIEAVLKTFKDRDGFFKILELGTGSGCLILSLLHELKNATGYAVDISAQALDVAFYNAQQLGLAERCKFKKSNWFENIKGKYDIIVSNPPYIPEQQLEELGNELQYDPRLALTPGPTGLESYEHITERIHAYMKKETKVFFEIGSNQHLSVSKIIENRGFSISAVHNDLGQRPRIIEFNLKE